MTDVRSDARSISQLLDAFARTTDDIVTLDELKERLASGRQLRMKYGIDLTAPMLHIGHAVNLWMYRDLQDLGHRLVLLLGDFTTQIGDPTGRAKTRPVIASEEIEGNAKEILAQVTSIVRTDPEVLEIRRNSEWWAPMATRELLSIMSIVTLDRLTARDMFRRRADEGAEIHAHELVYPLLQGYDSVALESDLTIVGTDQLFNEMMGRWLQERYGQPGQIVFTTLITPGIEGREKQSKSLGNYIAVGHPPREKFGRVMRIPDSLIDEYFRVYTKVSLPVIEEIESHGPMEAKLRLAQEIVRRYHGDDAAERELEWFKATFSERRVPDEAPMVRVQGGTKRLFDILRSCFPDGEMSNSELRRLIAQRAVKVDGKVVDDPDELLHVGDQVVQVGRRRWFRLAAGESSRNQSRPLRAP